MILSYDYSELLGIILEELGIFLIEEQLFIQISFDRLCVMNHFCLFVTIHIFFSYEEKVDRIHYSLTKYFAIVLKVALLH